MIITEKTPKILFALKGYYKGTKKEGLLRKAVFHNNEPINILVAHKCLDIVKSVVKEGSAHPVEIEYCIRYFSEVTGYSATKFNEAV